VGLTIALRRGDPLRDRALGASCASIGAALALALVAGAVRLLPWLFDPGVPLGVAAPFARGVALLALEAAVLLGWPLGWAAACARAVESGEARVFALLGEPPRRTVARLAPQGAALAALVALVSFLGGREASAPGRIVGELIAAGRAACVAAPRPATFHVPFVGATSLCVPGAAPRLLVEAPLGRAIVSAADARVAGDLRRVDLDDARLALASGVDVHVGALTVRGLPPWTHASSLPPWARALLVALSGAGSSALAAHLLLARRVREGLARALVLGAAGPLAALAALRAFERMDVRAGWFVLVPLAGWAAVLAVASADAVLWRLPRKTWAASN